MNHLLEAPGTPTDILADAPGAAIIASFATSTPAFLFRITGGMDCPHCAEGLQKMASTVPGVADARVYFSAAKLEVQLKSPSEMPDSLAEGAVLRSLTRRAGAMGFQIVPENETVQPGEVATAPRRIGFLTRTKASSLGHPALWCGGFLFAGLLAEHVFHLKGPVAPILLGASVFSGIYRAALSGAAALRERIISVNLLVAAAALGAIFLGQWEEAATVVALYLLGICLEGAASERARRSLHSLVEACPDEALVQRADLRHEMISTSQLRVGDILVVKPGSRIAADGQVLSGSTEVNQAALTGESLPVEKRRGDSVFAGSLNGNGSLLVRVEAAANDSTLARVLRLAEDAHRHKSKNQAMLERFGRVYTPAILLSAVGIAAAGPLLAPGQDWLHRALTLLVVACPCALIASTPMTHVCAVARASRFGVLVKGGRHLETLAGTHTVFFDKTGTLTSGQFHVTDMVPANASMDSDMVLHYAAAAERFSEHPIAQAIVTAAKATGNTAALPDVGETTTIAGQGITAVLMDGASVLVGTQLLMREASVEIGELLLREEWALIAAGKTASFVAVKNEAVGVIGISDMPRGEAAAVVALLQKRGQKIALLTGDNEGSAARVAQMVGIKDVRSRLLPEQKLAFVQEQAKSHKVIFVGDGLNDAPALAAASVGIALRGAGIEASLEAADVVLMGDDLSRLPLLFDLARATQTAVHWNLIFSMGTMIALLIGSVLGSLSLSAGIFAHEGGTLLVLLNGLRLLSPRLTPLGGTEIIRSSSTNAGTPKL